MRGLLLTCICKDVKYVSEKRSDVCVTVKRGTLRVLEDKKATTLRFYNGVMVAQGAKVLRILLVG